MVKNLLERIEKYSSKICFAALCVMIAYATLFATGDFSRWIGGFNLWGTALIVVMLCGIPAVLRNIKQVFRNPFLWILILFAFWNAVCLVVGVRSGNQIGNILGDVKSLIYFVLFPICLCVINSKKRILKLMHIAVVTALLLGVCTCVLLWSYAIDRTYFPQMYAFFIDSYFVNFTFVADKLPRILFASVPFQLYGCAFSVYFLAHNPKPKRIALYVVSCAFSLFTIIMTYTRALYLAAAVAALLAISLMLYMRKDQWKRSVCRILLCALGCVILLVSFSAAAQVNYFGFALQRVFVTGEATEPIESTMEPTLEPTLVPETEHVTEPTTVLGSEPVTEPLTEPATEPVTEPLTEPATEPVTEPVTEPTAPPTEPGNSYLNDTVESDGIRHRIKRQMMDILRESPLTGHGLGTVLPDRAGAPEYSYLDIGIKSGWIGVCLYLLPVALMLVFVAMDLLKKRNVALTCIWIAGLSGQMVYAIFQPYVYSGMAILLYCCTFAVCSYERQQKNTLANNG